MIISSGEWRHLYAIVGEKIWRSKLLRSESFLRCRPTRPILRHNSFTALSRRFEGLVNLATKMLRDSDDHFADVASLLLVITMKTLGRQTPKSRHRSLQCCPICQAVRCEKPDESDTTLEDSFIALSRTATGRRLGEVLATFTILSLTKSSASTPYTRR